MLVDGLDSALFALRMRLAGHGGDLLRGSLLLLGLTLVLTFSPLSRVALLAALGTYLAADLVYLVARTPLLLWRPAGAR